MTMRLDYASPRPTAFPVLGMALQRCSSSGTLGANGDSLHLPFSSTFEMEGRNDYSAYLGGIL